MLENYEAVSVKFVIPKKLFEDAFWDEIDIDISEKLENKLNSFTKAADLPLCFNRITSLWILVFLSGRDDIIQKYCKKHDDADYTRNNNALNCLHVSAVSGNRDAIAYVLEKFPQLIDSTDNNGRNLLHFAASSGNRDAIDYVLEKCPQMIHSTDNHGRNLLHFATRSGNRDAIDYVFEKCPQLIHSIDNTGRNLLHFATKSGNSDAIDYVLEKCPRSIHSTDNNGRNHLHFAAFSGSRDAIDYVLKKCPQEMIHSTDNDSQNLSHYAAMSGNPDAIDYVLEKFPELIDSTDKLARNLLHFAAWSGNRDAINYVLKKRPKLIDSTDWYRINFLHYAAWSGNCDAIDYVLKEHPKLIDSTDSFRRNLLHYAAKSGNRDAIEYVLLTQPAYSSQIWNKPDISGRTPDDIAGLGNFINGVTKTLNHLIEKQLDVLMSPTSTQDEQTKATDFLKTFSKQAVNYLALHHEVNSERLLSLRLQPNCTFLLTGDNCKRLTKYFQLSKIHKLTYDAVLNKENLLFVLENLVMISGTFLSTQIDNPATRFCQQLSQLISKQPFINDNNNLSLSPDGSLVLHHLIETYRREMPPENHSLHKAFAKALAYLEHSKQLQSLCPNTKEKSKGFDLGEAHYQAKFNTMRKELATQPNISEDTRKGALEVADSFQHIAENLDSIVKHFLNSFGKLYLTPQEIPLHTDHVNNADGVEFRKTLIRLLDNTIGAYLIAKRAGQQATYFNMMTRGYCLEGRSRDLFTWASNISEVKPFFTLMESYIKVYRAYLRVMYQIDESKDCLDESFPLPRAMAFILKNHEGMLCQADAEYAPKGEVTQEGVEKYLSDILGYEKLEKQENLNENYLPNSKLKPFVPIYISQAIKCLDSNKAFDNKMVNLLKHLLINSHVKAIKVARIIIVLNECKIPIEPDDIETFNQKYFTIINRASQGHNKLRKNPFYRILENFCKFEFFDKEHSTQLCEFNKLYKHLYEYSENGHSFKEALDTFNKTYLPKENKENTYLKCRNYIYKIDRDRCYRYFIQFSDHINYLDNKGELKGRAKKCIDQLIHAQSTGVLETSQPENDNNRCRP